MPRQPRRDLGPYGTFHVMSRGFGRCAIVRDDVDRRLFRHLFDEAASRHDWHRHAFVLMDNHFHAVVDAEVDHLSAGMHELKRVYAHRFNERHDRRGALFQGRFDLRVIESEEYLAVACEYVWNNPVKARLCATAADWPWSDFDEEPWLQPRREPGQV